MSSKFGAVPGNPSLAVSDHRGTEEMLRDSGLTWTILRPTWVFGPGDVSLNRFLGFARVLPFVPMTSFGNQQLAWKDLDAAAGPYVVGFLIEDLDGNVYPVYEEVRVN